MSQQEWIIVFCTELWITRMKPAPAFDALAIPVILATLLENKGYDVDFRIPWGLPHSGDYDMDELFAWIDQLCKA